MSNSNATVQRAIMRGFILTSATLWLGACSQAVMPDGRTVYHLGLPSAQQQAARTSYPAPQYSPPISAQPSGPPQTYQHKEGRYVLEATLTPVGGDQYRGSVGVGTGGCGGGVEGPVTRQGNVYTLVNNDRESSTMCRVKMVVQGRSMTVSEDDCQNWHGASCEFNGKLIKVR